MPEEHYIVEPSENGFALTYQNKICFNESTLEELVGKIKGSQIDGVVCTAGTSDNPVLRKERKMLSPAEINEFWKLYSS